MLIGQGTEIKPAGVQEHFPQKVLIISDEHRGSKISNFPAYQASILALMTDYQHVVELGDNAELLYIKNEHAKDYASLLEILTHKDRKYWEKEFNHTRKERYHKTKSVIRGELSFLEEFLERYPHVKLHKVLGNHENVIKFRNQLDQLQKAHPNNFEWSPEAIRIGDGLFTHAHLQMGATSDQDYTQARLRDAKNERKWRDLFHPFKVPGQRLMDAKGEEKWRDLFALFEAPGHLFVKMIRYPDRAAQLMHEQLKQWDGTEKFHYVHNGSGPMPFKMDWVKHVFFGHTHHKFHDKEKEGVLYHNSGAVVEMTSSAPGDLGILEAELHKDGTLKNIRPVTVLKDKKLSKTR